MLVVPVAEKMTTGYGLRSVNRPILSLILKCFILSIVYSHSREIG